MHSATCDRLLSSVEGQHKRLQRAGHSSVICELRSAAVQAFVRVLEYADAFSLVTRKLHVSVAEGVLWVGDGDTSQHAIERVPLDEFDEIVVVGGGKAGANMARGAVRVLEATGKPVSGALAVPAGAEDAVGAVRLLPGGHPLPTAGSAAAADAVLSAVRTASPRALCLALLSGGASALLAAPASPLSLEHKQHTTQLLLRSGAPIQQLNALRKHLSAVKGGLLARACAPRRLLSLVLSDVVGDSLEVIASGPTVPDSSTFDDCWHVCRQHQLTDRLPDAVRQRLEAGTRGELPETPKPTDRCFERTRTVLIGSAAQAAAYAAQQLPNNAPAVRSVRVLTDTLEGEARDVARWLLHETLPAELTPTPAHPTIALIASGELTVTIRGNGVGGRNQELLLAMLLELQRAAGADVLTQRCAHWAVLAAACDGIEGNSPAAGALIDDTSLQRAAGIDLAAALARNDSHRVFEQLGDCITTGLTGTNINDLLVFVLIPK